MAMKLNLAYPQNGSQKLIELDDDKKTRLFYDRRLAEEVPADALGDEFKGYIVKITGGHDKQGFAMKQGVLLNHRTRLLLDGTTTGFHPWKRPGHRKRKSVRGCIIGPDIAVINAIIVKKGAADLPGLTDPDSVKPSLRGPKRANNIRKLWGLTKEDDVRQFVSRKKVKDGKDGKPRYKSPKIQRLITPVMLHRKKHRLAVKKRRYEKSKKEAADYAALLANIRREKRKALIEKRRALSERKSERKSQRLSEKVEKDTKKVPAKAGKGKDEKAKPDAKGAKGKADATKGKAPATKQVSKGELPKGKDAKGKDAKGKDQPAKGKAPATKQVSKGELPKGKDAKGKEQPAKGAEAKGKAPAAKQTSKGEIPKAQTGTKPAKSEAPAKTQPAKGGDKQPAKAEGKAPAKQTKSEPAPKSTEKPAAKPAAEKPAAKPATEKPAAKPATEKPAAKPATEKPAAKPATEKPAPKPAQPKQGTGEKRPPEGGDKGPNKKTKK